MDKGKEDFNFKFYKRFDVDELKNKVLSMDSEWLLDTSRQKTETMHRRTEAYHIYNHPLDWKVNTPYRGIQTCKDQTILSLINPIVKELEEFVGGKIGQCLLVKLKAHDLIGLHKDGEDYLMYSRRFHMPVMTNEEISFTVGDETKVMREGECWEINNGRVHAAHNKSKQDRVQLIFDIIPKEFIG
jgi:hypothetical protein